MKSPRHSRRPIFIAGAAIAGIIALTASVATIRKMVSHTADSHSPTTSSSNESGTVRKASASRNPQSEESTALARTYLRNTLARLRAGQNPLTLDLPRDFQTTPEGYRLIILGLLDSDADPRAIDMLARTAIIRMGTFHGREALALFQELLEKSHRESTPLPAANIWLVAATGESEPALATEWLIHHPEFSTLPGSADGYRAVLTTVARTDLSQALDLLEQFPLERETAITAIARNALSYEDKSTLLAYLRQEASGMAADPSAAEAFRKAGLSGLAEGLNGQHMAVVSGISGSETGDTAIAWLSAAGLSTEETQVIASSLKMGTLTTDYNGMWLEWIAASSPPGELVSNMGGIMSDWARTTLASEPGNIGAEAEKWINSQPEGEMKAAAMEAFVRGALLVPVTDRVLRVAEQIPDPAIREDLVQQVQKSLAAQGR